MAGLLDSAYQLTNITYAYFTNRPHILLLYIEPSEEMIGAKKNAVNQINAPTRRLTPVEPPASLQASMFILFDCIKKTGGYHPLHLSPAAPAHRG